MNRYILAFLITFETLCAHIALIYALIIIVSIYFPEVFAVVTSGIEISAVGNLFSPFGPIYGKECPAPLHCNYGSVTAGRGGVHSFCVVHPCQRRGGAYI